MLECKLSLSLSLIAQAQIWTAFAHYVSIVTPYKRQSKGYNMAKDILKKYGIGFYEINKSYSDIIIKQILRRGHHALCLAIEFKAEPR